MKNRFLFIEFSLNFLVDLLLLLIVFGEGMNQVDAVIMLFSCCFISLKYYFLHRYFKCFNRKVIIGSTIN